MAQEAMRGRDGKWILCRGLIFHPLCWSLFGLFRVTSIRLKIWETDYCIGNRGTTLRVVLRKAVWLPIAPSHWFLCHDFAVFVTFRLSLKSSNGPGCRGRPLFVCHCPCYYRRRCSMNLECSGKGDYHKGDRDYEKTVKTRSIKCACRRRPEIPWNDPRSTSFFISF